MNFWHQHKRKIAAVALLTSAMVLITSSAGARVGAESPLILQATTQSTAPLLSLMGNGALGVTNIISGWFTTDLETENEALRQEVARLREEKTRLIGVLQENDRLRRVLDLKAKHPEYKLVPAQVIARDASPYFRVMHIKIATNPDQPIKPRMPVIVAEGLVGQVHRVFGKYAEIIIVSDPRHRVDAIAQRTRAQAIVEGLGHERDYLARLAYLRDIDEVRQGDILVTSGMGEFFPRELIIGTVNSVAHAERGLFQEATITPAVDFSRLEEVFVLVGVQ